MRPRDTDTYDSPRENQFTFVLEHDTENLPQAPIPWDCCAVLYIILVSWTNLKDYLGRMRLTTGKLRNYRILIPTNKQKCTDMVTRSKWRNAIHSGNVKSADQLSAHTIERYELRTAWGNLLCCMYVRALTKVLTAGQFTDEGMPSVYDVIWRETKISSIREHVLIHYSNVTRKRFHRAEAFPRRCEQVL